MEYTSLAIHFVERVMAISPRIPTSHLLNDDTTFISLLSGNVFLNISNTYIAFKVDRFFFFNLENAPLFYYTVFIFGLSPWSELGMVCLDKRHQHKWSMQSMLSRFSLHFSPFLCHTPHSWPPPTYPKDTSGNNLKITHQGVLTGTQKA